MGCQDYFYFQKSKKLLHSHWLGAVSIHLKSVSIWGLYRNSITFFMPIAKYSKVLYLPRHLYQEYWTLDNHFLGSLRLRQGCEI